MRSRSFGHPSSLEAETTGRKGTLRSKGFYGYHFVESSCQLTMVALDLSHILGEQLW